MLTQNGVLRKDENDYPAMGGTSSVDNQTIINSAFDPVTRRLLVDISGTITGNTLNMEIPSGTVNGSNTIFTVQNLPIFVDTSGQVNVSSTQDATNYGFVVTGSAPSYTLTFSNAPTQTPHSFYNANTSASGVQVDNEIVAGSGTSFTLANVPTVGTALYALGQRLTPTTDYTISGANITLVNSLFSGQLLADYDHA